MALRGLSIGPVTLSLGPVTTPVILPPYIILASADRNRPCHNQYLTPAPKAEAFPQPLSRLTPCYRGLVFSFLLPQPVLLGVTL